MDATIDMTLDDERPSVADLADEVFILESAIGEYEEYVEGDIERMCADRERLLEALGLTEHEWACRGGERFAPFKKLARIVQENRDPLGRKTIP